MLYPKTRLELTTAHFKAKVTIMTEQCKDCPCASDPSCCKVCAYSNGEDEKQEQERKSNITINIIIINQ